MKKRRIENWLGKIVSSFRGPNSPFAPEPKTAPKRARRKDAKERTVGETTLDEAQKALWERLSDWRRQEARTRGVPVYLVLTNRTLFALAVKPPRTREELAETPGIGPKKLDDLGDRLLDLVSLNVPSKSGTST